MGDRDRRDTLGWLAVHGKDFGKIEQASEKKRLVQSKAKKAVEHLKILGVLGDLEYQPLSPVLRFAQEQKTKAGDAEPAVWDDVVWTVRVVKYYVALANGEAPAPEAENVLLSDVDEEILSTLVSQQLNITYLQRATEEPLRKGGKIDGIFYGYQRRPFYSLTVRNTRHAVVAPFLSDSGAQSSYLNEGTFEALGYKESIPEDVDVLIEGFPATVRLAVGDFRGINVIGADFKRAACAVETLNYRERTLTLRTLPHP